MTARIQRVGTPNLCDASVMKAAHGSAAEVMPAAAFGGVVCATAPTSGKSSADPMSVTVHIVIAARRKHVAVLAPIQGRALLRRPGERPRPPLCATAVRGLAGREEWVGLRSN
jgi:hypothetical protein